MSACANVTGSNKTSITEQTHFMSACMEQLFQFLLHLLKDTSVWLMKRVKMRETVPARSIFATTWPCSASRPSASRLSLLPQRHQGHYPPPHPRPICVAQPSVLNRSPLTGQPGNMSTSASRLLLDFFFILNYCFAAIAWQQSSFCRKQKPDVSSNAVEGGKCLYAKAIGNPVL